MQKEYVEAQKTTTQIAKETNTVHSVICKYLKIHNIKPRHPYGTTYGDKHWNWKNGFIKSQYTSYFKRIRKDILKLDNYKCRICNLSNEEHISAFNRKLEVHHIDFDKQNDNFGNLISLCKVCHLRLNLDMDYWYAYCKYITNNR